MIRNFWVKNYLFHRTVLLYYFHYTSRPYENPESLIKDLNQCVEYRKTRDFFIKTKDLHSYFERNGGSLATATANANHSMKDCQTNDMDYTYSELGRLMKTLEFL